MTDYRYIIFILILLFFVIKSWYGDKDNKYFKWSIGVCFVFIGCRACVVGADTYNYTQSFLGNSYAYTSDEIEPLFVFYINNLSKIIKNEVFFILCNTIFSLISIYYLILKFSTNKTLSVFCFFVLGIYLSYFVVLRQILAISILFIGLIYVIEDKERKWFFYIALSVIAFFVHRSTLLNAIIFLLLYFIPLNKRELAILLIIVFSLIGVVFQVFNVSDIFNYYLSFNTEMIFTDRFDKFVQEDQINSLSDVQGYIWLLRYSWLGCLVFSALDEDKMNHLITKIYLASIIIFCLFYNVDMIVRINLPFNIFSIITIAWALSGERINMLRKKYKYVNMIVIFAGFFFFQAYVRSHMNCDLWAATRMHPYYFFFEDYSNHPSIKYFN